MSEHTRIVAMHNEAQKLCEDIQNKSDMIEDLAGSLSATVTSFTTEIMRLKSRYEPLEKYVRLMLDGDGAFDEGLNSIRGWLLRIDEENAKSDIPF